MRNASLLIIATLSVTLAAVCQAGTMWHYTCTNSECRFEGKLGIGGGWSFDEAPGYCTTCKEFVKLKWDVDRGGGPFTTDEEKPLREESADAKTNVPEKVGTVWNLRTGEKTDLYPCPKCRNPFAVIGDISSYELRTAGAMFCPRCGEKSLKLRRVAMYD